MQHSFQFKREIDQDKTLEDLFDAYFDARKNKRNTINALVFEKNFESKLFSLFDEIMKREYEPKPSICFIVHKPVKREVFAADFRDRVIHHFIYNYIYPIFEKKLINDTFSCRKEKGVHYGIRRADHFIRSCSRNYKEDCFILKLDIKSYFMSMRKDILYSMLEEVLAKEEKKIDFDLPLIKYLLRKTIFNDPVKGCIIKGKKEDWEGLPKSKSLFNARPNCGLPIGNLTSQLFGNVYLNDFDHFVKEELKIRYYGRYVDDLILVHNSKDRLKKAVSVIRDYLKSKVDMTLHPDKIYLQHFSKGAKYLGVMIKPYRIYISNRTKGNFYNSLLKKKKEAGKILNEEEEWKFKSMVNSYLGTMKHFSTFRVRKKILHNFSKDLITFSADSEFSKIL